MSPDVARYLLVGMGRPNCPSFITTDLRDSITHDAVFLFVSDNQDGVVFFHQEARNVWFSLAVVMFIPRSISALGIQFC